MNVGDVVHGFYFVGVKGRSLVVWSIHMSSIDCQLFFCFVHFVGICHFCFDVGYFWSLFCPWSCTMCFILSISWASLVTVWGLCCVLRLIRKVNCVEHW